MNITKEKVEATLNKLELKPSIVFVDMKFFLKDICNPFRTSELKYFTKVDLHKYFTKLHRDMSHYFEAPVLFIYSNDKIKIDNLPTYKELYYSKYFDDEERNEILSNIKEVFRTLSRESAIARDGKFVDSSNPVGCQLDEIGCVRYLFKSEKLDEKGKILVITKDSIFSGYKDIVTLEPYELISGNLKPKTVPEYYRIVLAIGGCDEYSIPGATKVKEKTAMKIIKKIKDIGEYIYYNDVSTISQPVFPITYEVMSKVSNITTEDYEVILNNWKLLN